MMFGKLIGYRSTQEKIVDKRVRLLTEVIGHIRSVKLYAYERVFSDKVSGLREQELSKLKKFGFVRAMIMSTFNFLPILAAVGE
jgi:ATP-binding cassette subfamily C (CFTR/MRP) protein 1